jgi:hypothetical protein
MPLSRLILPFLLALGLFVPASKGSSGWKPISDSDLRITAAEIGDPDADAAILFREGELDDDESDGTSLKIYVRIKIFNERGRRFADIQLPYRVDLGKITDVHGRTVKPDGTPLDVENKDIFDKLVATSGRNVWRAKTFSMPSAGVGSIIEYRYRQAYPAGFRYFALDLQSELFIKQLVYRIKPKTASPLDMRWVTFNASDPDRFTPVWDGTYNIRAQNVAPFRREPLMPPDEAVKVWGWLYYSKDAETEAGKYWKVYGQDLYWRMMAETRPSQSLRKVVDAITLPTDSADEKIERIYSYLQNEIRNVTDAELDSEKLKRSSTADETLKRRYGTARDINRLFVAMLRTAGFDARVGELTARDENFFHRTFADSFQFNSEVAAVLSQGRETRFFDPGTPGCPSGLLSWEKEGVPALVYDKESPEFITTPVSAASCNVAAQTLIVSLLPDGRSNVKAALELGGQRALDVRSALKGRNPEDQRARLALKLRESAPASAIDESSIKVTGADAWEGPVKISYNFIAPLFAPPTEKRFLLRPALLAHKDESLLTSPRRTNSVYFPYPWSEEDRIEIQLPDGFTPEQLPDDVNVNIGVGSYQSSYKQEKDRVVFTRNLTVNGFIIAPQLYQTLKSFFDRAHEGDRGVLFLKR